MRRVCDHPLSWKQTLGKIEKRVWKIGWGGSVHCSQNAGTLPIDS